MTNEEQILDELKKLNAKQQVIVDLAVYEQLSGAAPYGAAGWDQTAKRFGLTDTDLERIFRTKKPNPLPRTGEEIKAACCKRWPKQEGWLGTTAVTLAADDPVVKAAGLLSTSSSNHKVTVITPAPTDWSSVIKIAKMVALALIAAFAGYMAAVTGQ